MRTPPDISAEDAVVHKVMWRIIPFVVLLYLMNYIDRVNVSIAKLQMVRDVPGFGESGDDRVYALGVSLFFIGYFLFEIPSNLIQEKVGPRRWMARIMISWGLISACFLFVRGPVSFYVLRFLLGVAEAGFFPGMILYLSYWIPARQRAKAGAVFLTSTAIAGIIGNPLGGFILYATHELPPLHPWQWLFLLEGIPTVLLGISVLWILTDQPKDARWLTTEEREILMASLARERQEHPGGHTSELRHAFTNPKIWLLGLLYALIMFGFYTINYWTPTISKQSLLASGVLTAQTPAHIADFKTGLLSAIPFGCAAIGMFFIGRRSDRTGERHWHIALSAFLGAAGLAAAAMGPVFFDGMGALVMTLAGLSFAGIGIWATLGPFWTLPPQLLTGTAAAAGIALVNSLGNLGGGFIGPNVMSALRARSDSYFSGLLLSSGIILAAGVLALLIRRDRCTTSAQIVTKEI